jgi:hypothetical protein
MWKFILTIYFLLITSVQAMPARGLCDKPAKTLQALKEAHWSVAAILDSSENEGAMTGVDLLVTNEVGEWMLMVYKSPDAICVADTGDRFGLFDLPHLKNHIPK